MMGDVILTASLFGTGYLLRHSMIGAWLTLTGCGGIIYIITTY